MNKNSNIVVKDVIIKTIMRDGIDYICITDIARQKNPIEPKDVVKNWMRQKNTLEYLGLWEKLNNPMFKGVEFDPLFSEAKEWRENNPESKGNIRDYATINELICISNMENINSVLINEGIPQGDRLEKLNKIAIHQMNILENSNNRHLLK